MTAPPSQSNCHGGDQRARTMRGHASQSEEPKGVCRNRRRGLCRTRLAGWESAATGRSAKKGRRSQRQTA
eukprot:2059755-Pyramimonas_sp.AAC.1